MIRLLLIFFSVSAFITQANAQETLTWPVGRDGIPIYTMPEVVITSKAPKKSEKARFEQKMKKFNKVRMNVIVALPYANEAAQNLREIHTTLAKMSDPAAINDYNKQKEKSLFGEYEDDLRTMTTSQGKILIKLIDRQSGFNTYSIIKDLKSGASAVLWQAVARVFGFNLKTEYDPEEDAMIEAIVRSIETGTNLTYYDFVTITNGAYQ